MREAVENFNIQTIAEAENGAQLLKLLETHSPDVVLLDLRMPGMDGNDTMDALIRKYPDIKVIIVSFYSEQMLIDDYEIRGAKGYAAKGSFDGMQLAKGIKKVHEGGKYFYRNNETPALKLSERQKDIVHLKSHGISDKLEIGEQLGMTSSGVGKQEKKIMEKMKVSNIAAFYEYIFESGLKFLRRPKNNKSSG